MLSRTSEMEYLLSAKVDFEAYVGVGEGGMERLEGTRWWVNDSVSTAAGAVMERGRWLGRGGVEFSDQRGESGGGLG